MEKELSVKEEARRGIITQLSARATGEITHQLKTIRAAHEEISDARKEITDIETNLKRNIAEIEAV